MLIQAEEGEEGVWTHESQLPLWLVRAFEEKLQRQEALVAQHAARSVRAGMTPGVPSACGRGFNVQTSKLS